jgi:CIC family chloride channel protein
MKKPLLGSLREPQLFLALALLIGIFSGLAVVCFRIAIDVGRVWLRGASLRPPPARLWIVLPVTGLCVALLVEYVFPLVRGSGVNQTKAAMYVYDGYIAFRTVIGKFVTSALAIGSGQSLGPEDPSLQIGAGLASLFGRACGLSRDSLRLIAPVGAAAGLAAAFNSPITAVLFVIEEVIGTWSAVALGAIVLSAVSSVVVAHWFLGDRPLFRVPEYHLGGGMELAVYALLGVAGALVSLIFVKLAVYFRARLRALPRWTHFVQPALAGAAIAAVATGYPQVMGAGYIYMDAAMHDQYSWRLLAGLAFLKLGTTVLSFSSGVPGGMFAPTLFIGAMLGGAVCGAAHLIPGFHGSTGVYALVGMGTLFAGILRAPMTSVFMIIEVSGNYSIVLPVMISNTIAYLLSRKYQREAIFDVLSRQDGLTLPSMEQQRESTVSRVEDAMLPPPAILTPDLTLADALERTRKANGAVIAHPQRGRWMEIDTGALERAVAEGKGGGSLGDAMNGPALPTIFPDQPLDLALRRLGHRTLLPVVHRGDASTLVGVIGLQEILGAYRGQDINHQSPIGESPIGESRIDES